MLSAEDEPKYLNSPETAIYKKSHVLYNLHRAKESVRKLEQVILVEGYMDAIGLDSAGVHEVVASCGTALTSSQVRALKRHSENIVVNFDPDAAGSNAAERSIQMLLEEGMRVKVLELEGGLDPDDYIKQAGVETYRAKLGKAPGYFYWLADRARGRFDMRTAQGRVSALQFLLPAIQRVSDKLERAAIAADVASYLAVEPGLVLDHFRKSAADRREKPLELAQEPVRAVEKILLNSILLSEEIRAEILPRLAAMPEIAQFTTRRIFQALFALYANQPRFQFSDLEARLEESDRALFAAVVFADELGQEHYTLTQAQACLKRLEEERLESEKTALRTRVREAERSGDFAEAFRLSDELGKLGRGRRQ